MNQTDDFGLPQNKNKLDQAFDSNQSSSPENSSKWNKNQDHSKLKTYKKYPPIIAKKLFTELYRGGKV